MSTYEHRHDNAIDELIEAQRRVTIALSGAQVFETVMLDFATTLEDDQSLDHAEVKAGQALANAQAAYNLLVEAADRLREIAKEN